MTGRATYTHDVNRPGMLYGRVLRSPYAHADIVSIDTSKLDAMGVVWVKPDKKKVRYHGEAVLALAAATPQLADDALHAVAVKYDVKPHTVRLVDAMKEGAPLVFEKPVEEKRSAGDAPSAAAPWRSTATCAARRRPGRATSRRASPKPTPRSS